jgi:primary-amine oxidase
MMEEFFRCEAIVKADKGWREAMRRRGLSDADMELAQIDPFSSGFFDRDFERGRRIVRAISYYRADMKDNAYAHPIEGVVAVVDLIREKVVDLVDEAVVPIPMKKRNYNRESVTQTRTDLKPLDIVQPEGPSFTVDGWKVSWQNWHRSAPACLQRQGPGTFDHSPRERHRDGRAVCRSHGKQLLEERV